MTGYRFRSRTFSGDLCKYIVCVDKEIVQINRWVLLKSADLVPEYIKQGWQVKKCYKDRALIYSLVGFSMQNFLTVAEIVATELKLIK